MMMMMMMLYILGIFYSYKEYLIIYVSLFATVFAVEIL